MSHTSSHTGGKAPALTEMRNTVMHWIACAQTAFFVMLTATVLVSSAPVPPWVVALLVCLLIASVVQVVLLNALPLED